MTTRWEDMQTWSDVAEVRRLAADFARPAYGEGDEFGEPYIQHPAFGVGPAVAFVLFLLVMVALLLAVVMVQAARHWLGLGELALAGYGVYLAGLAGDRMFGRAVGWLR